MATLKLALDFMKKIPDRSNEVMAEIVDTDEQGQESEVSSTKS